MKLAACMRLRGRRRLTIIECHGKVSTATRRWMMFEMLVLGLDGSESSKRAIPVAAELAKEANGKIVIAHVEEDVIGKGGGPIHATEDEIQAEIKKQAEELSAEGIDTEVKMTSVMLGGPAHAIASIADDANADLIVVGTRGHSPVAGLLLGGVTQRLLHIAHQPVLAVPPAER
jgi:nucleotide-binding universal stress UspA family protein